MADRISVRSVIVDDSEGFVDLGTRLLVAGGIDVVGAAGDGERGLQLIRDLSPDVAFVDLYLGTGNGLELISDIVHSGLAESTFLILLSSCADEDLYELFECSDADGYLTKVNLSGEAVRDILRGNGHGAMGDERRWDR